MAVAVAPRIQAKLPSGTPAEVGTTSAIVQGWVTAIGAAAFAFAVMHAAEDQAGAWWSIRAILSISVTAALLALWLRLPAYVFISGLLLNAAGVVGWLAWGPTTFAALVQINVLCLAAGSVAWSLLEAAASAEGVPHWHSRSPAALFRPLGRRRRRGAAGGVLAAVDHCRRPLRPAASARRHRPNGLDRPGATAVAVAVCLWDRKRGSCWRASMCSD